MRRTVFVPVVLAATLLVTAAGAASPTATSPERLPTSAAPGSPTAAATPTPTSDPTATVTPTAASDPTAAVTPSPTSRPAATRSPAPKPAPVKTAAAAALALSLTAPTTAWEDRTLTFTGRLSNGESGWFIALWGSYSTGWRLLGWTRTVDGGGYTITYRQSGYGTLTVKTATGGQLVGALAMSPVRTVTVRNRTNTLQRPASAYTALTGVTLVGQVIPAEPGRRVVADYVYNGAWRAFALATADASGVYRIRIPDDYQARWTVRTRTLEVPADAVEYSSTGRFAVMAYLNPEVSGITASDIPYTYRSGCPVGPSSLRRLELTHWGFDNRLHRGELIVRDGAVSIMTSVWNSSLLAHFPIRKMRRVDVYGGNDIRSMEADNTSVFNCRHVTGDPFSLSPHSYGYAIDINTVENPYQDTYGRWYPSNGLSYRDRSDVRPGMLFDGSTPTRALVDHDYFWGKYWRNPDYQHFQPR